MSRQEGAKCNKDKWPSQFLQLELVDMEKRELRWDIYTHYESSACRRIQGKLTNSLAIRNRFPNECLQDESRKVFDDSIETLFEKREEIIRIITDPDWKPQEDGGVKLISRYFFSIVDNLTQNRIKALENEPFVAETPSGGSRRVIEETREYCIKSINDFQEVSFVLHILEQLFDKESEQESRRIIELRFSYGLSFDDIAERMGIKPAAARKRYERLIRRIRKAIVEKAKRWLNSGAWNEDLLKGLIRELEYKSKRRKRTSKTGRPSFKRGNKILERPTKASWKRNKRRDKI